MIPEYDNTRTPEERRERDLFRAAFGDGRGYDMWRAELNNRDANDCIAKMIAITLPLAFVLVALHEIFR